MRRVHIVLILSIIAVLLSIMASSAQARWSMWVYRAETGRLLQVDNNGQVISTRDMPAEADNRYPQGVVVSPEGDTIAYLSTNNQQITVMSLANGQAIAQIGLSDIGIPHNSSDRLILNEVAFDSESNQFVYVEILGGFGWQIHVYDVASNRIIHTLHYGDVAARQFRALHGGIIPVITAISGDRVTFSADIVYPVGIHSYHWFYQAGILSENVAAPTLNAQSFPYSDDVVNLLHDYRFPAENDDFELSTFQHNALHAYTFHRGRFPIFFEPTLSFKQVWFVQGGERLLVQGYVNEIADIWVLIERAGNEIRRYAVAGTDVTGTPDGFIYTTSVESQTAVVNVDTRNSESAGSTLWIQPGNWQIVWAGSNRPDTTLVDWVQLAQPVEDPSGSPNPNATPTQAPAYSPFRRVGQQVQVYVPENGYLNLRDAPTTDSNILTLLESGTRGTIINGPVAADGFIWWEISVTSWRGWVVQELPDSLALIPPQLILSITPTPTATERP